MCFGQSDSGHFREVAVSKILFSRSYLSISITPELVQKARIIRQSGEYRITTSYMDGIELGGNYRVNFNKTYSLIFGLHAGTEARNYKLSISKND